MAIKLIMMILLVIHILMNRLILMMKELHDIIEEVGTSIWFNAGEYKMAIFTQRTF